MTERLLGAATPERGLQAAEAHVGQPTFGALLLASFLRHERRAPSRGRNKALEDQGQDEAAEEPPGHLRRLIRDREQIHEADAR